MSYRKATKGRGRAKDRASNTELCVLDWGQDSGQPPARTEQRDQSPGPGEEFCADKAGQMHQVGHVRGMERGTRGAAVDVVSPPPAQSERKLEQTRHPADKSNSSTAAPAVTSARKPHTAERQAEHS